MSGEIASYVHVLKYHQRHGGRSGSRLQYLKVTLFSVKHSRAGWLDGFENIPDETIVNDDEPIVLGRWAVWAHGVIKIVALRAEWSDLTQVRRT